MDQPNGKKSHNSRKAKTLRVSTGEVHSVPVRAIARHDYPTEGVKVADAVYVLHPVKEDCWKI